MMAMTFTELGLLLALTGAMGVIGIQRQARRGEETMSTTTTGGGVVEAVVRALRVMDVLWDHAAHGLSSTEAAEAAREGRSYTTRALQTLEAAGYVTRHPETGRWAPAPRLARLATRYHRALGQARARIDELEQRVGRLTDTGGSDE